MDWTTYKKQLKKNKKFREAVKENEIEYTIARAIIEARVHRGISQAQLAGKLHTTQSVISRLESGNSTPSVRLLKRLADALNLQLHIEFTS